MRLRGSYKKLYDIKYIILTLKLTEVVYKGLGCIEAGGVPHSAYVCFEAISNGNTLLIEIERG